MDLVKFKK